MADIVLDSSVIIKWFVPEPYATQARTIRVHAQAGAYTLLGPDLVHAELGNIVWKKQTLQGLSVADARRIIGEIKALPLAITPAVALLDDAYRLAVAHSRTVYDSLYIALSLRAGCTFVTADERLANSVASALPNVVWLGAWMPPSGGVAPP